MNRLTASFSLYAITFFAAIQYVFLTNVPDTVSTFAFLAITNLVGFIITLAVFFGELKRLDRKQVLQSFVLSLELIGFNLFLLLGSRGTSATATAAVMSSYFVFIVILSRLIFREKPEKSKLLGIVLVLFGVFLMMDANVKSIANINVLFLVIADIFFALYLLTAEKFASSSNPSILAMGQTLFNFLIALAGWGVEAAIRGTGFGLPTEARFWGSVFFISFFIRGMYGIVQIYAQRYVTPLRVALIFSTEIIMTMLLSPLLARLVGGESEPITPMRLAGAACMMGGILIADSAIAKKFKWRRRHGEN